MHRLSTSSIIPTRSHSTKHSLYSMQMVTRSIGGLEGLYTQKVSTAKRSKGLFTQIKSGSGSEKDERINDKHQRKFSLSLSLGVNGP